MPVDRLSFLLAIATLNGERGWGNDRGRTGGCVRHVSDAFEQTSETISQRANNAINDMVRQRLLNRFTSEITEGNAIYRLTPLGIGITDYVYSPARVLHPTAVDAALHRCRRTQARRRLGRRGRR
ncbi:hypothetical protein ACLK2E_05120 [Escherichia coli]